MSWLFAALRSLAFYVLFYGGSAFLVIAVTGQMAFLGVGMAFFALGIVFLAKSRKAG